MDQMNKTFSTNSAADTNDNQVLVFHCIKIPHCLLIIISNTILITALVVFKSVKRHSRHYFTLNLGVSDFLMGAEGLLHSASYFLNAPPYHPVVYTETFLLKATVHASLLTFLVIAVAECRAVEAPLITELTRAKCLILITFLWMISIVLGGLSTYIKAVDSSIYLRVKQFELTFYLSTSLVICSIYGYIFWLIFTRRTKFDFSVPRPNHYRNATFETDNHLRVSVSSLWNPDSGSNRNSFRRTFSANARLSSFFDIKLGNNAKKISTTNNEGLRVSSGRQQFYNTKKAAITAALITLTFMVCFIPYVIFYARNLLAFVQETPETTVLKYYVNGIVFSARSLLNPLIQIFRTTELREKLIASCRTVKRKIHLYSTNVFKYNNETFNLNNNIKINDNCDSGQRTRL